VAVCRTSGTFSVFLNGTRSATVTYNQNFTNGRAGIGNNGSGSGYEGTSQFSGYISNFRIVTGSSAYNAASSSFTVPTSPLTVTANTTLLACTTSQGNRVDISKGTTLTIVSTVTQSDRVPPTLYSAFDDTSTSNTVYGGSYYFNGTTDYLSIPNNAVFDLGTGSFTFECWVYTTSFSTEQTILATYPSTGTIEGYAINITATTGRPYWSGYTFGGAGQSIIPTSGISLNTWNHLAFVNNSGSYTIFINGVPTVYTGTFTQTNNTGSNTIKIGAMLYTGNSNYFKGYISNIRLVKGTALYTANTTFTPSTSPLQPISNTSLLLSGTNSGIYDQTLQNNIQSVGDVKVRTDVSKYGTGSIYFDGNGDGLNFSSINLGAGDLTVEWWGYQNANLTYLNGDGVYAGEIFAGSSTGALGILTYSASQSVATNIWVYVYGVSTVFQPTISISLNQWNHFALTRASGSWRMFVNGTQVGTTSTTNGSYNLIDNKTIGYRNVSSQFGYFPGYIDDFRITKSARYTANFTPSVVAFNSKSRSQ
jgi:hypothetical protein